MNNDITPHDTVRHSAVLLAIIMLVAATLACAGTTPTVVVRPTATHIRPTPRVVPTAVPGDATPVPTPTLPPDAIRLSQGPLTIVCAQDDRAGAQAVLQVMSDMISRLSGEIGLQVEQVEVRLFASREAYNDALGLTAPADQVGNIVDKGHIWLLTPSNQTESERADMLKGAQVQMARVTLLQVPSMPLWLRDGIASYEARLWNQRREEYMRSLVVMRRITGLQALDGSTYAYMGGDVTAHTVVDYFVRTYGLQALPKLVAGLQNAPLDQTLQQAVDVSLSDFSRGWYAFITSTYSQ